MQLMIVYVHSIWLMLESNTCVQDLCLLMCEYCCCHCHLPELAAGARCLYYVMHAHQQSYERARERYCMAKADKAAYAARYC